MTAIVASAFALALFCFLVLAAICVGSFFAFVYRRYYGLERSPVVDVEAPTSHSPSTSSHEKAQESATSVGPSSEPYDETISPKPKPSGPSECSNDKLDRLAKQTLQLSSNDKSTWKRRALSWVVPDDMQARFSSLGISIAKAKAQAKEKWISCGSEPSLATMDIPRISEDVPCTRPEESAALYSKTSASGTRSLPGCVKKSASASIDPSPTPSDIVSVATKEAPRLSTPKQPPPTPRITRSKASSSTSRPRTSKKAAPSLRPSISKKATSSSRPRTRKKSSTSRNSASTSASTELTSSSSASTPALTNTLTSSATTWEPQTPDSTTILTSVADRSVCRPSPSTESLEARSTDPNVAGALALSEGILASGSLPSCVSGLSDVIGCLDVRASLIEDLAKAAVDPALGLNFDPSWLSQAVISISLGGELPTSCASSPMPPKVIEGPPRLSTSDTITTHRENMGPSDGHTSSGSTTACAADRDEQKTDEERYAALVGALSTTFSLSSLQAPSSSRYSVISASTSSSPSVARSDLDCGLETSYELSYDASESDFDGFGGSDDEDYPGKSRPRCAMNHSLRPSASRSEESIVTLCPARPS